MKKIIKITLVTSLFTLTSCSIPKVKEESDPMESTTSHEEHEQEQITETKVELLSNARRITQAGRRSGNGYFNNDGTKMVFQSERMTNNPFFQTYYMDLNSGQTSRLSTGVGDASFASIHPSKNKAIFSSTHLDKNTKKKMRNEFRQRKSGKRKRYSKVYDLNFDIFETDLNGKRIKRLTSAVGYDSEASYSPNGREIVFTSNRSGYSDELNVKEKKIFKRDNSYTMEIYKMNANGSGQKRLTHTKGYDGAASFSFDGKLITWNRFSPKGKKGEIYIMKSDGTHQTRVTKLNAMSWAPSFHPSGDYIIFGTSVHGYRNFELYIVDTRGKKKPVRVTDLEGFDGNPVFLPNGRKLSWTRKDASGTSQVFVADWNDTAARKLLGLKPKGPRINEYSSDIKVGDIKRTVSYLASDELKGRASGSIEEKKYATRLGRLFKNMGLKGAGNKGKYFQAFKFTSGVELGALNSLKVLGKDAPEFEVKEDWMPLSFSKTGSIKPSSIVFAGYGLVAPATNGFKEYDSYKGIDVNGKWVLVFRYTPENVKPELAQHYSNYSMPHYKAMVARNKGARGVIFVSGPNSAVKEELDKLSFDGGLAGTSIAVISVTDSTAQKLLDYDEKDLGDLQDKLDSGEHVDAFKIKALKLVSNIELNKKQATGINILAQIKVPGATKSIVVGAHGDHLGLGHQGNSLKRADDVTNIHYGADDNASGVSAIMEMAHHLSDLYKKKKIDLKYNIIFAVWSAEEIGILGSSHYVNNFKKRHRIKQLNEKIKAYVNLDMVGRLRKHLIVQSVASSDTWPSIVEEFSIKHNLVTTTQKDPYVPTDAMTFYMGGTPTLAMFTGAHGDYHSPRDTWEKLNYEGLKKITEFSTDIVKKIATSRSALRYNKVEGSRKRKSGTRKYRVFLGTIPDYSQDGVTGVRLSGAAKGGPAQKAGVKNGDIIIKLAGNNIENLYDYVYVLQALKPNKPVKMIVKRNGAPVTLVITPAAKQ